MRQFKENNVGPIGLKMRELGILCNWIDSSGRGTVVKANPA
jgi:hypothetical protein